MRANRGGKGRPAAWNVPLRPALQRRQFQRISRGGTAVTNSFTMVLCGCGTANYWNTRALARAAHTGQISSLVFCDHAEIRQCNAITCPQYREEGQPKC